MKKYYIALMLLFLTIYIVPLGIRPLIIPDEDRYGEIPREMIASGNWIAPQLNGVRYFEKPVMGYWLNALSMIIFGENAFAIRFPSAISAGLSALMMLILLRRYSQSEFQPVLAALVFLSCFQVYGIGVFSVLDSILSVFLTAAIVSYFYYYMEKKKRWLVLFGVCCGLAFLTKGFLAFAVPIVVIVPFMLWERQWKDLLKTAWIPIASAILISLPWCVMIHLRESDFWHYFFWIEHIKRFTADDAQHVSPFWYFIPCIIGGAMPWTFLSPAVVSGVKNNLKSPLIKYAWCWCICPFLFFSVSRGKLLTYILPCFAPLAVLISAGLSDYFDSGKKKAVDVGGRCLIGLITLIAVALLINQLSGFPGIRAYNPSETWKWILGIIGLLSWAGGILVALTQSDVRRKLMIYGFAPAVLMIVAHFILPNQTIIKKAPGSFLLSHQQKIQPDTMIVSSEDPVRAVCWFYKRSDVYVLDNAGELSYGLSYKDSKHRWLTTEQLKLMIEKHAGKNRLVFITAFDEYQRYSPLLPKPAYMDTDGGFVLAVF
jgi:4-amino-4-deoxy-L-arabinose transferase